MNNMIAPRFIRKGKFIIYKFTIALRKGWKKLFSYRKFYLSCDICLGITAVLIPPGLVVYHRWLNHPSFENVLYKMWFETPLLKQLSLPTYFLIIFPLFILSIYCFGMLAIIDRVKLPDPITEVTDDKNPLINIPKWQNNTSTCLFITAGICLVADMAASIIRQTISGIEVLGIALLYIFGLILKEFKLNRIIPFLMKHTGWVVACLALYSGVLVALQSLFGEKGHQSGAGAILVFIIAAIMIRFYGRIPVILWISLGTLILVTWGINSWRFSVIGDEHDFYRSASYIATMPLSQVAKNFFSAMGVFGTHTFLASLVQAGFMKIFGVSNFGWRISNPVMLSAAVVCFYLFFRKFGKQRTALVIAGLLACSGYLMNFGKIGYDNSQAFFMFGLTLWLAAEAVLSRRPVMYAVLGLAMGFCLYSYPAALYILPLPVLLMALYDFPRTKQAVWRWLWWIGMAVIIAVPLLFQPVYGQGKLEGLFIHNPDIDRIGIGFMFGSELIYSLFSYVYIINESHFVTSSHIDPISAVWVPIGMAWIAVQLRRNKFALFWVLSFGLIWFLAGASHGRQYPPNTRMIMLLPFWCSFVAFGITWLAEWIESKTKHAQYSKAILAAIMIVIVAANLVQVKWVFPRRYAGSQSLEMVFVRLTQRVDNDPLNAKPIYLFVTDEAWGIDGLRLLQDLYHSPQSKSQLDQIVMTGATLDASQLVKLKADNTIIIPQPWMKSKLSEALTSILIKTGKVVCPIRVAVDKDVKFTAYFPPNLAYLCPFKGIWEE
ncbi:MAG: glycosyltransferase family 39 protein [Anaerolineaceae bacterium]